MLLTILSLEYRVKYDLMQMLANAREAKMASLFSTVLRGNGIVTSCLSFHHDHGRESESVSCSNSDSCAKLSEHVAMITCDVFKISRRAIGHESENYVEC